MENILREFRNEIRANSNVGEHEELLALVEKEIDKLSNSKKYDNNKS